MLPSSGAFSTQALLLMAFFMSTSSLTEHSNAIINGLLHSVQKSVEYAFADVISEVRGCCT